MEILEKAGEIMVECGYAETSGDTKAGLMLIVSDYWQDCDPFADTLESRQQADAIEDWFDDKYISEYDSELDIYDLWMDALGEISKENKSNHQWRLDRIKYCLKELTK